MNKQLYRIVYNAARGLLMAVAETASAHGKADGPGGSTRALGATLSPVAFAAMAVIGSLGLLLDPAQAQIVGDPNAPRQQRPTVLNAANGVPLVHIQAPSAAGVSRNTYSRFDVQRQGAILNNSRTPAQTQLGGWVQGNPWLAKGPARIILNEVNAADPSQLRGWLEVAGQRAQVVIANPAGITCDGCGFINASRATLTTGTPVLTDGGLDGYLVGRGTLRVEGAGLDATQTDYTELIARAVQVNAGLWANTLQVTTGANRVAADGATATPAAGDGTKPAFAIDVAQLGGMYAGKIRLVGTEAGVGVRNAGTLGASAGQLVVTADGRLENAGDLRSSEAMQVSAGALSNTGRLHAGGELTVASRGELVNDGVMASAGSLSLEGGQDVRNNAAGLLVAGLQADGRLGASGHLAVRAGQALVAQGRNVAAQALSAQGQRLDLSGSQTAANMIALTAQQGDIDLGRANVQAERVTLQAAQTVRTDAGTLQADELRLQAQALSNRGGTLLQTGPAALQLELAGTLDNSGGRIATQAESLRLQAGALHNTKGRIEHAGAGTLSVRANVIEGAQGTLLSGGTLALSGGQVTLDGATTEARQVGIQAEALSHRQGRLLHTGGGPATVEVAQTLDNTGGRMASNGRLAVRAGQLDNRGGELQSAHAEGLRLDVQGRLDNAAGRIESAGHATLQAARLNNTEQGRITAAAALDVQAGQHVDNSGGTLAAGGPVTLATTGAQARIDNAGGRVQSVQAAVSVTTAGRLDNSGGLVVAEATGASLEIAASQLANRGGTVQAAQGAVKLDVLGRLDNSQAGAVQAGTTATVSAGTLDNQAGRLTAQQTLHLQAQGAVDNRGGLLAAGQSLAVQAGDLQNADGRVQALAGDAELALTGHLDNTAHGQVQAGRNLKVEAAGLNNGGGLYAVGRLQAAVAARLDNTGILAAGGDTRLTAGEMVNQGTAVLAAGLGADGRLTGQGSLQATTTGRLASQGQHLATGDLKLEGTHLDLARSQTAAHHITLTATAGEVGTQAARVTAGGTLAVSAHASPTAGWDNAGGRASAQQLQLQLGHLNNTRGDLAQTGQGPAQLVVTGTLDNTGGRIAGNAASLHLAADRLINTEGRIEHAGEGRLQIEARQLDGQRGQVASNGELAVAAGALVHDGARMNAERLSLAAASVSNVDGHVVATGNSAANIDVQARLDNRRGLIATNGAAALRAGELDNRGGTVQAAGDAGLLLHASGTVDNSAQGRLLSAGHAKLDAQALLNANGQLTAGGALTVTSAGTIDNAGGTLAAQAAVTLQAARLDNRAGTVASVGDQLDIGTEGRTDNTGGRLQSRERTVLKTAGLLNAQGTVTAGQVEIDTRGQSLDNAGGTLAAQGALTVRSGELNNHAGRLQAGGDLQVTTQGERLVNTGTGATGGISSQGLTTLDTGLLDNQGGFIGSRGAIAVTAAAVDNRLAGVISSEQALNVQATGAVDNRGGQMQALQDLGVQGTALVNTAGLLRSGATLAVHATTIDNRETGSGADKGLEGRSVTLATETLDNRGGAIRADEQLQVVSRGRIDNSQGRMSSAGLLTLAEHAGIEPADAGAPSPALFIQNTGGTLLAGRSLSVTAAQLGGDGRVLSQGDLALQLAGDFDNSGEVRATRDSRLAIGGRLLNSGRLTAGGRLDIAAQQLDNQAAGEIAAGTAHRQVTGTLTNRGLIDGERVRIEAAQLDNLGTGRLYGSQLAIAAQSLRNDAEGGRAATIAARERLDLGVQSGVNREQALIFSGGDLALGGALDDQGRATGQAGSFGNHSASIEVLGSARLDVGELRNSNEHFSTTTRVEDGGRRIVHLVNGREYSNAEVIFSKKRSTRESEELWTLDDSTFFNDGTPLGEVDDKYLLLPSERYPFSRFGPAGGLHRVPEAAFSPDRYIRGELQSRETYRYGPSSPLWDLFGVQKPDSQPPAYVAPCDSECSADQQAYADWKQRNHERYVALNAEIETFAADVQSRRVAVWDYLDVSESRHTPVVQQSDPGRISVDGELALHGSLVNDKSQVVVGGALSGDVGRVQNVGAQAEGRAVRDGGRVHTYFASDDRKYSWAPHHTEQSFSVELGVAQVQTHTQPGYAGQAPVATSVQPVGASIDRAGAVTADARIGQIVEVPAHIGTVVASSGQTVNAGPAGSLPASASQAPGSAGASLPATVATPAVAVSGPASAGTPTPLVVRTVAPALVLPNNSLFLTRPEPGARYLVETDPRFTQQKQWLGSDYLLQQLATDPSAVHKRLGDGFYEQRLLREQVAQLTGRRFLDGYADDEAQYRALMNNGATVARQWGLRPGVALSAEQMAQLTSDIVWLVEREVVLADGSATRVLVPQVYVRVQPGDVTGDGSLIAARDIDLRLEGDLDNIGTIAGRRVVQINAGNIANLGGRISGGEVALQASEDLSNLGGVIDAGKRLTVTAGRDLTVQSTTATNQYAQGERVSLDRVAGLYVSQPAALLLASAGRDLNLQAAQVNNAGEAGQTLLAAGRNLTLGTVATHQQHSTNWNAKNWHREASRQEVGSVVQAAGDIRLQAGQDVAARGASVSSSAGAIAAAAGRDVKLEAAQTSQSMEQAHYYVSKSLTSKTRTTTHDSVEQTTAQGSTLSGETVSVQAGRDLAVRGSGVASTHGTTLQAGRDVVVEAVQELTDESHLKDKRKSGVFSSGGSLTLGKQQKSTATDTSVTTAARSTVGSTDGSVTIKAGGAYRQAGSDVVTPQGDVDIAAQRVDIVEAREAVRSETEQRFKQSGLSVSVSSPVIAALQSTAQAAEATSKVQDSRMKALGTATTLMAAKDAAQAASQAASGEALNVSLTVGSSRSENRRTDEQSTAAGSRLLAEGDVRISARGDGARSDLTVQGSQVQAGGDVKLQAEDELRLLAARNTVTQRSSEKSSSAAVGVAISVGPQGGAAFGVTASASAARGKADGQDVVHTHTRIEAGKTASLASGTDTTVRGAVVNGDRVQAQVGGDLKIESLQDTSTSKSRHENAGGSVTAGMGFSASGSYGRAKVEADYASVQEQSGIQARDGGFDVAVKGNTDLKGGVIASSGKAVEAERNRLSTGTLTASHIVNRDSYRADAVSLSGGGSVSSSDTGKATAKPVGEGVSVQGFDTKSNGTAAGIASESGSQRSVTTAGISQGQVVIGDEAKQKTLTGGSAEQAVAAVDRKVLSGVDAGNGLKKEWDGEQLKDQVRLGAQITAEASRRMPKALGEYADNKQRELLGEAAQQADPVKRQALVDEAGKWGEGGVYRVGAHALLGGLVTGSGAGAAGAGASAATVPVIGDQIAALDAPEPVKHALVMVAGAAVGAAAGNAAGAAAGLAQTSNNYLQHHSKILDPKVQQAILRAGEDCKGPASCSNAVAMLDAQAKLLSDDKIAAMCGGDPSCVADRRIERSFYVQARDAATGRLSPDVAAASFLASLKGTPYSDQQLAAAVTRMQGGQATDQPVDEYVRKELAKNPVMLGSVMGLSLLDTDGGKGGGAAGKAGHPKLDEQALAAKAEQELLAAINAFPSRTQAARSATMIAAYDPATGKTAIGESIGFRTADDLDSRTVRYIEGKLGVSIGEFTTFCRNKVGACAEVAAADQLVRQGVNPENIRFTKALRPGKTWGGIDPADSGATVPTCENCAVTWPKGDQ